LTYQIVITPAALRILEAISYRRIREKIRDANSKLKLR